MLFRIPDTISPTNHHSLEMSRPLLRPLRSCRNPLLPSSRCSQRTFLPSVTASISRNQQHLRQPALRSHSPNHRAYHSHHHPDPPPHEYTNSQTTILTAALKHVPSLGFTRDALTLGARDTGFLDVSIQLLPRGEFDLILFWLASRRGLVRAAVEQKGLLAESQSLSVEDKTKALIMERLRMNSDIRHQWQDVCESKRRKERNKSNKKPKPTGSSAHVHAVEHPALPLRTARPLLRYPPSSGRHLRRCVLVYEASLR